MKSKMSFCNPTLLKKNILRFPVIWAIYTGLLFLCCTLPILNIAPMAEKSVDFSETFASIWTIASVPVTMIFAIVSAAASFSYLHKSRSAYMMHAFPMTRTCLFNTNFLTGLLFGLVPELVITLLNLLAAAMSGINVYTAVWQLLGFGALEYLFFYGLAVFCMVMSGRTVYAVLGYFVLNFTVVIIEAICRLIYAPMLYGIVSGAGEIVTYPFSPAIGIYTSAISGVIEHGAVFSAGWLYMVEIAAAGVILAVIALLMYRKRHVEQAGEVVAYRWARPVFKYFFTVFVTLVLGLIILSICSLNGSVFGANAVQLLTCLLIAAFVGYLAAEMMLKRTLRVFKAKAFIGFAAYAIIIIAVTLSFKLDVLGIVHRVPQPETVSYCELVAENGAGIRLKKQEDIAELTQIQREMIDRYMKDPAQEHENTYYGYWGWTRFQLVYHLKDGSSITRSYQFTDTAAMKALVNQKDVLTAYYDSFHLDTQKGGSVFAAYSSYGYLNQSQLQELADCLQKDLEDRAPKFYQNVFNDDYYAIRIDLQDRSKLYIPADAEATSAYLRETLGIPLSFFQEYGVD